MQQDYFSSFNQSDHCFLALSMPLPSSLLKLPIFLHSFRVSCRRVNNDTHLPYLVVRDVSIFHSFLLWLRYESLFRPRRFVNENQRHVPAMNLHKKKEKKSIKISQAFKAQYHKNKTKVGEGVWRTEKLWKTKLRKRGNETKYARETEGTSTASSS